MLGRVVSCRFTQGNEAKASRTPPPHTPARPRDPHLETLLSYKGEHRAEPSISHDVRFHDAQGAWPVVVVPRLVGLLRAFLCFLLEDVSSVLCRLSRKISESRAKQGSGRVRVFCLPHSRSGFVRAAIEGRAAALLAQEEALPPALERTKECWMLYASPRDLEMLPPLRIATLW